MTPQDYVNQFALMIRPPAGAPAIDCKALLTAIATVESEMGTSRRQSRYEDGFRRLYANPLSKPFIYRLTNDYGGDRISTSYGITQIMALVAYEMGMPEYRPPEDLYNPVVCLFWTVELLNEHTMPNAYKSLGFGYASTEEGFIKAVGDAYNSGSARDGNVPQEYINKLWKAYQEARG